MEIALLAALILLNGVFAMSEIALVTARRSRLQKLADEGDRLAALAMRLGDEPTQFLSTVQVGITAIGVLNGIVGEAAFAGPLGELIHQTGLNERLSYLLATTLVVAVITYATIVIGELVPKRIAQFNAEGIARLMAGPIASIAKLSGPFVWILSVSTDGILRLLGKHELGGEVLTEEDIHAMLVEGSQAGVIEKHEHEMLRNVFRLDDRQIVSLMTPRSELVYFDVNLPVDENMEQVMASDHSRFPVCRGSMDEVLGVVTAKRLLKHHIRGRGLETIVADVLPPVFVPESLTGMKLLEQFRESGVQMVFVVDEYGEVLGLITLQDLLEALAGEFKPRDPEDVWAVQRTDGSWLLDGLIPIVELKDRLELKYVPDEEKGRYHTLAGMLMWLIGKLPREGEVAEWEGWRLEVVDLDGKRIDKVMATMIPEAVLDDKPGDNESD